MNLAASPRVLPSARKRRPGTRATSLAHAVESASRGTGYRRGLSQPDGMGGALPSICSRLRFSWGDEAVVFLQAARVTRR